MIAQHEGWEYHWQFTEAPDYGTLFWSDTTTGQHGAFANGVLRPRDQEALVWKGMWYRARSEQGVNFDPEAFREEHGGPNGVK